MAPTIIDFNVRPFILTHSINDGYPSIGFGAAADVYVSGATQAHNKAVTDTYFTYKYAAAQMQVNCEEAGLSPERAQTAWESFALCQRAMAEQALQASSSDADQITFSLTRGDDSDISLSPKRLSFVPGDGDTTQTPSGWHDRSRRGQNGEGIFSFVVRSGDYGSSAQLIRDFGDNLNRIQEMEEPSRRIFLASEETQARLKTDALVELAAHVPMDSIDSFDWNGAISELFSQSQVRPESTRQDSV